MSNRMRLFAIVLAAFAAFSCKREPASGAVEPGSMVRPAPTTSALSAAHDPTNPPIDCPLHNKAVDPAHLRPFEDVEKYIAFLERPDRAVWQKPDAVVTALGLAGNETVVDVGAGSGYFTFRFAKVLAHGKVVAVDLEPEMIRHIHHEAMTERITNVEVVLGDADDPKVPQAAGLIFVCDVLHHVANRASWLSKMYAEAGTGSRLVVIEFKEGDLPEGPPKAAKLPPEQVVRLVTAAGFAKVSEDWTLLPYQYVLTFAKR